MHCSAFRSKGFQTDSEFCPCVVVNFLSIFVFFNVRAIFVSPKWRKFAVKMTRVHPRMWCGVWRPAIKESPFIQHRKNQVHYSSLRMKELIRRIRLSRWCNVNLSDKNHLTSIHHCLFCFTNRTIGCFFENVNSFGNEEVFFIQC